MKDGHIDKIFGPQISLTDAEIKKLYCYLTCSSGEQEGDIEEGRKVFDKIKASLLSYVEETIALRAEQEVVK